MTPSDPLTSLLATISGPEMMGHLREFDRWTKHAGTGEELESLRYAEARMAAYGYQTEILLHDAYISLPGPARVEALGRTMRCITHSFSRPSGTGGLDGELVHVGAGGPSDLAGLDLRGKLVLVDGIASPGVSLRASRAGAAGQVHVSPHEHLHEMCISPVWGSPTHETVENLPSTVVVTVPLEEGEALKAAFRERPGGVRASLHAEVDTGWRQTPILVGDLPGPDPGPDEPFVLFSGHHDTWYYGVMDNGGANATMLEVARVCAQRREFWRRGLRVIYWSGHSQGRYSSSTWYADAYRNELDRRATVHVNVDSTGGKGNTIVADTTAAAELRGLAREALESQAGQQFSGRRMQRAGDQSFWGIGVPSIFGNMSEQPATGATNASAAVFGGGQRLGHGTGWWWHNPADTLDKMDEEILVRDTRIYLHVVWRLLADDVLPLNYDEHARYLQDELHRMHEEACGRFDLSGTIRQAETLEQRAAELRARIARGVGPAEAKRVNSCLRGISRALVPVDYTAGDRFEQDPALGQEALPSLRPIHELSGLEPTDDRFKFLTVGLMRARNKVEQALRDATTALESCLSDLGGAATAREDRRA